MEPNGYGNYIQGNVDTNANAYNLLISGASSGYTSSGINIGGDTSTTYGVKISNDASHNAFMDVRGGASNTMAFRHRDNTSGSVSSMLELINDSALSGSGYGATIAGRMNASSYYVGQVDNRAPINSGVYMGTDGNVGYFNINKGSGTGGFAFNTYNANGSLLQSNLNLKASGIVQASYYTASGNANDTEEIAVMGIDASGNLVRNYNMNKRYRDIESRLTASESAVNGPVLGKVNEVITRLNGLNFFSQNISTIAANGVPSPSPQPNPPSTPIPSAPTNLVATPSYTSVSLSFTPSANATSYSVTSSPGGITVSGSSSPIVITGLSTSTSYSFSITSSNSSGTSGPAISSAVSTLSPTYTFYDIPVTGGTLTFPSAVSLEVFMIGGGGGGGSRHAGGGGAGAYYYTNGTPLSVTAGTTFSVSIGAGGSGSSNINANGSNGGDTVIQVNGSDFKRVRGGGGGGSYGNGISQAPSGGCGGGGQSYNPYQQ